MPIKFTMSTATPLLTPRHVAVIGAGAGGLVAARELRREGHQVVIFERGDQLGGSWVYTPEVESDPLGLCHTPFFDQLYHHFLLSYWF
jgi:cation diffusion facilitator CzcD-associated flavoprotein CzcO